MLERTRRREECDECEGRSTYGLMERVNPLQVTVTWSSPLFTFIMTAYYGSTEVLLRCHTRKIEKWKQRR